MKLFAFTATVIVLLAISCVPVQATAYFVPGVTQQTSAQCVPGALCPILAIPGATIQVCVAPNCTSTAVTFTDSTGTTQCPSYAQVLQPGGGTCVSTSDANGNFGFWVNTGSYNYYVTVPANLGGQTLGPFPLSVPGSNPAQFNPGFQTLSISSNNVALNLDSGLFAELTLNQAAQVTILNPSGTGGVTTPGSQESWMTVYIIQDSSGGRPSPTWGSAYGADVLGLILDGTPRTRSAIRMALHPDGLWHLDSFLTGQGS